MDRPYYDEATGTWVRTWERDPELDNIGAVHKMQWLGCDDSATHAKRCGAELMRRNATSMLSTAIAQGLVRDVLTPQGPNRQARRALKRAQ